ncbi:hypothetical protein OBBRIDRAFT_808041 [Obba rivulosa]|uniref:Uncharacterized protein n=1 Tax=Obba rivulosa TaxID=1052685 RepID=A0A8E2AJW0_9APHY|nr:hypothetical protein OBBRIDRAFT_808041 [Obba rivulosa]
MTTSQCRMPAWGQIWIACSERSTRPLDLCVFDGAHDVGELVVHHLDGNADDGSLGIDMAAATDMRIAGLALGPGYEDEGRGLHSSEEEPAGTPSPCRVSAARLSLLENTLASSSRAMGDDEASDVLADTGHGCFSHKPNHEPRVRPQTNSCPVATGYFGVFFVVPCGVQGATELWVQLPRTPDTREAEAEDMLGLPDMPDTPFITSRPTTLLDFARVLYHTWIQSKTNILGAKNLKNLFRNLFNLQPNAKKIKDSRDKLKVSNPTIRTIYREIISSVLAVRPALGRHKRVHGRRRDSHSDRVGNKDEATPCALKCDSNAKRLYSILHQSSRQQMSCLRLDEPIIHAMIIAPDILIVPPLGPAEWLLLAEVRLHEPKAKLDGICMLAEVRTWCDYFSDMPSRVSCTTEIKVIPLSSRILLRESSAQAPDICENVEEVFTEKLFRKAVVE